MSSKELTIRSVVEEALRIIGPQAEEKGLRIAETWQCAEDTEVLGDENRIRQILLNLLSNSLKFTDQGTITVRCEIQDAAPTDTALPGYGPWVVVAVEESGRGIPEDQLARVFEPFVQVESGHTRRAGGTGLGLTISRRLARLMAGELTAVSEAGVGSRFALWLSPAVQERVPIPFSDPSADDQPWPPEPHELPGLASAGRALLSSIDGAEQEWIERLRTDPVLRAAERANRAQLADQTAELIAAFAKVLFVLEEGGGDPALLKDAEVVLEVVAIRHGRQRRRLGWGRAGLEREYHILGEILDTTLRHEAPKRTAANLGTALEVLRRLVGRAASISIQAFGASEDDVRLHEHAAIGRNAPSQGRDSDD